MIIFTRRTPAPAAPLYWQQGWDQVRNLFPPGRVFSYITQTLVVARYSRDGVDYFGDCSPAMYADYLDATGKLYQRSFTVDEIPLLLAIDAAQIKAVGK